MSEKNLPQSYFPKSLFRLSNFPAFWDDIEDYFKTLPPSQSGLTVSEDKKNVYVEAHLPGLSKDLIDITLDQGVLWIRGEKKEEKEDQEKKFYQRAQSSFSYRFTLPERIDGTKEPKAEFKDGILSLTFTKAEEKQAKKIKLN